MEGLVSREWNSSPPIIVVVVSSIIVVAATSIVTSVVTESVNVADHSQLLLNLRPLRSKSTVVPTWTSDAIDLASLLQDSPGFVGAAVQVAPVTNA
jgi:hypothetical protein